MGAKPTILVVEAKRLFACTLPICLKTTALTLSKPNADAAETAGNPRRRAVAFHRHSDAGLVRRDGPRAKGSLVGLILLVITSGTQGPLQAEIPDHGRFVAGHRQKDLLDEVRDLCAGHNLPGASRTVAARFWTSLTREKFRRRLRRLNLRPLICSTNVLVRADLRLGLAQPPQAAPSRPARIEPRRKAGLSSSMTRRALASLPKRKRTPKSFPIVLTHRPALPLKVKAVLRTDHEAVADVMMLMVNSSVGGAVPIPAPDVEDWRRERWKDLAPPAALTFKTSEADRLVAKEMPCHAPVKIEPRRPLRR